MNQETRKNLEKSTSERLSELWQQLSHNQRRFVIASLECATKKDAALSIGIEPNTVYGWPDIIDEAIKLAGINAQETALGIITQSAAKAAMVKTTGLDSDDEKIRQAVAAEILDRVMGKAVQRQEVTGKDGEAVGLVILPAKEDGH